MLRHNKQQSSSSFFSTPLSNTDSIHMETCYETPLFVSVCRTPFSRQATADRSIIMFSYHHVSGLNDAWMDEKHAGTAV